MNQDQRDGSVSRRGVIAGGLVGAAALVLGVGKISANAAPLPAQSDLIYPHPDMCIGCLTCEMACSDWHRSQKLSPLPRIHILRQEEAQPAAAVAAFAGDLGFAQDPCVQCAVPECWAVCPADALRIDGDSGARYIDEERCIACGKCQEACPFPINGLAQASLQPFVSTRIQYDAERDVYVKCDLCRGREGGPACVEACPVNRDVASGRIDAPYGALELRRSDMAVFDEFKQSVRG